MTKRLRLAFAFLLVPGLLTSGCVGQGLSFRVDERVKIVSPRDRAELTLPVTLEWTVRDFELKTSPSGPGGSFAVFIDRAPIPPGKELSWLARNDSVCATTPGCPDPAYFARLGVHETTDTKLTITKVDASTASSDRRDRHRAVIVLLDDEGKRIGEIAYDVTFDLKRKG